jgi:hypothetical protein
MAVDGPARSVEEQRVEDGEASAAALPADRARPARAPRTVPAIRSHLHAAS